MSGVYLDEDDAEVVVGGEDASNKQIAEERSGVSFASLEFYVMAHV